MYSPMDAALRLHNTLYHQPPGPKGGQHHALGILQYRCLAIRKKVPGSASFRTTEAVSNRLRRVMRGEGLTVRRRGRRNGDWRVVAFEAMAPGKHLALRPDRRTSDVPGDDRVPFA